MTSILRVLATLVLALFAGLWCWIGFSVVRFVPTEAAPVFAVPEPQVIVAGFLASAVGAGTASVLGIEIQKVPPTGTLAAQVRAAGTSSPLLMTGVVLYALLGIGVIVVWMLNPTESPEMVSTFAMGSLGWLAGAFAAVFRKE